MNAVKEKVKILFIIDEIVHLKAGTENQLAKLINGLDKRRYDVHLFCLMPSAWIKKHGPQFLDCSISIKQCLRLRSPMTYYNIVKLILSIRALKPDIVHTFFPNSNALGVFAARFVGVKCIISSRRDLGQWMNFTSLFFTKIANRFISGVHVNSYNVRELTERVEGIPRTKINVIYNGIDIDEFKNKMNCNKIDIRSQLNIPPAHKIVGSVANLRPMKNLETLIKAAALVKDKRSDFSFVLVGDGRCRNSLEELADRLGIKENVFFVGSQEDIIPYLRIFDLAVNCSSREGLSNAVIEYMLAGVPCIVSESGGNTELIDHGWNGSSFAWDDHETLASLIMDLIDDEGKKRVFRERSRQKIEKTMTINKMIENFDKYYSELLRRNETCKTSNQK
jgi:L-malate glycosyltransferase